MKMIFNSLWSKKKNQKQHKESQKIKKINVDDNSICILFITITN
jgi:hypothetical protein